jgi:hypothetical protein
MLLASIRVAHLPQAQAADSAPSVADDGAFVVRTCQRTLWIHDEARPWPEGTEVLTGIEAYAFLLRVTTGLESRVVGETDVFGQFKECWLKLEAGHSRLARELSPWIQRLFEDTKEIRSLYLQNAGSGSSYGVLIRKLLKREGWRGEPILMMGAGQIARGVAPYLLESELRIWNRTPERARALVAELASHANSPLRIVDDLEQGWAESRFVVICTPEDPAREAAWAARHPDRRVIHLGTLKSAAGFFALENLFALQQDHDRASHARFAQAARACDQKALLRSLPGSLLGSATLPHGWEDLAQFA